MTNAPTLSAKRAAFKRLHRPGNCFIIPNPWDLGSARFLQGLGFKALATSSAGFSWSQGHADHHLGRDRILAHIRELAESTDLPVNADFENGFGGTSGQIQENVRMVIDAGVAGISIEDASGHPDRSVLDLETAVKRIQAARAVIDAAGGEVLLVGRAENYHLGRPDLDDTIRRLKAYSEAGADCLFAPGLKTRDEIGAVVRAVAPKPVNVLIGGATDISFGELSAMGVRRVSVGGALARVAWGAFMSAARGLAERQDFSVFSQAASGKELDSFFRMVVDEPSQRRFANIVGLVEYREGEGMPITIPKGAAVVEATSSDVTISWTEGASSGSAAMPLADFCRYVAHGAITVAR